MYMGLRHFLFFRYGNFKRTALKSSGWRDSGYGTVGGTAGPAFLGWGDVLPIVPSDGCNTGACSLVVSRVGLEIFSDVSPLCVYLQECWTFLSSSHSSPLAGLDDRVVSERLTEILSDTLQVWIVAQARRTTLS